MISIMIVDDEPLVRASVQSFQNWEDHGFSFVCEASDGFEALEELEHTDVDLILLDIHMPRMDGLEFLEKLKERDDAPCIIVLSANDHYTYVRRAFQLGAVDYILKSDLDEKSLLDLLRKTEEEIIPGGTRSAALKPKDLSYMRQMLLMDLFQNRNPDVTRPLLADIGVNLDFPIRICFLWLNGSGDDAVYEMIRLQASQFLKKQKENSYFAAPGKGRFFFLLKVNSHTDAAQIYAESFCRDFIEIIQNGMDLNLEYALSSQCESYDELPGQFRYVSSLQTIESRMIRRAKKYIRKNYSSPEISLEEVSGFVEVSKAHLSSQFRKETGMTFRDYLTKIRIEQAEKLLLTTNGKVYEISEEVGYPNVEHFSRIFKKTTGMTPNRYASGQGN